MDGDGFSALEDCDDTNPHINPDQEEEPYNGIDDDCDPDTLDDDLDQDGFVLNDDCDDEDASINPDAEEITNNDVDEDCDGIDLLTSTHEIYDITVHIYTKPTSDIINIDVDGNLNYRVILYNVVGKVILTKSNTNQILTHKIPEGTYLLEIRDLSSAQKTVERIVVTR
jgi:hypothetical protein